MKKFSKEEDVGIVQAWINVTTDPLYSGKPPNCFWSNIFDIFDTLTGNEKYRTKKDVQNRFHRINKEVETFVVFQADVNIRNPSMAYEERQITARLEYYHETGNDFEYEECYEIFKSNLAHYNPDE
ncbi:uncharacterized protein LOC113274506 [Papaver somniferum]|uniref:uncharacterized protein LOC113274506 n=1 Tax=Papaver somniferum TaxID=3469 RepID=UPI000E6F4B48|nr:uncharacterized protein LOC113274506 [Papaver somniferum]